MILTVPADLDARAAEVIGAPFRPKGSTPAGWDCRGLVRWCYDRWCGLTLPTYEDLYDADLVTASGRRERARLMAEGLAAWRPSPPQAGATAWLSFLGVAGHIGFMLSPRLILHADAAFGTATLDLDDPPARYRLKGAFVPAVVTAIERV